MSVERMSHSILRQCTLSQFGLVTRPPVSAELAFHAHLRKSSTENARHVVGQAHASDIAASGQMRGCRGAPDDVLHFRVPPVVGLLLVAHVLGHVLHHVHVVVLRVRGRRLCGFSATGTGHSGSPTCAGTLRPPAHVACWPPSCCQPTMPVCLLTQSHSFNMPSAPDSMTESARTTQPSQWAEPTHRSEVRADFAENDWECVAAVALLGEIAKGV